MFKRLFVLILPILLFSFSSCGFVNDPTSPKAMRISGILTEQPVSDPSPGTHLLSTSNEVYGVSSILVKLSDKKYLNNEVELIGSFDSSTNLFSVSGISVLKKFPDNLDEEIEEIKFVDYKNTDFGVELKYYDNFTVVEEENSIIFVSPSKNLDDSEVFDEIKISQEQFRYDASVFDSENIDNPLKNYLAKYYPEIQNFDTFNTKIGPDLLDSVKIENEFGGEDFILYRNGIIYKISFLPHDPLSLNTENKRVFDDMVSSFKFIGFTVEEAFDESDFSGNSEESLDTSIEETNTVGVMTFDFDNNEYAEFESKAYGFKAIYPKKWYYEGINSGEPGVNYSYVFGDTDTPSMDPNYSLSIVSNEPNVSFKEVQMNGVDIKTSSSAQEFLAFREINGKKFLCKGGLFEEDKILATILNISLL